MKYIGIADTTFARYDMGAPRGRAQEDGHRIQDHQHGNGHEGPAVACKKLIEEEGCEIVMALGCPTQGEGQDVRP